MSLPWNESREGRWARAFNPNPVDGEHSLSEYIALYRRGVVGPLAYELHGVPVVVCRTCGHLRLKDGTPCRNCGAYQRCAHNDQDSGSRAAEAQFDAGAIAAARSVIRKPINPRRSNRNAR